MLKYIIPVVVFSALFNIPKFFEATYFAVEKQVWDQLNLLGAARTSVKSNSELLLLKAVAGACKSSRWTATLLDVQAQDLITKLVAIAAAIRSL